MAAKPERGKLTAKARVVPTAASRRSGAKARVAASPYALDDEHIEKLLESGEERGLLVQHLARNSTKSSAFSRARRRSARCAAARGR